MKIKFFRFMLQTLIMGDQWSLFHTFHGVGVINHPNKQYNGSETWHNTY